MGFILSDILRFIDNLLEDKEFAIFHAKLLVAREKGMSFAEKYHLDGDNESFRELWFLFAKATLLGQCMHEDAKDEVDRCLDMLKLLVETAPSTSTKFGEPISTLPDDAFQTTQIASISGKYVVFSDHHMLFHGARQNFFKHGYRAEDKESSDINNYDLYLEVLADYYGAEDFTLVENGDIEELLIFEPQIEELRNANAWFWSDIYDYREIKKKFQLPLIASDNRTYYEMIQESFVRKEKYYRITGNHDRDMRDPAFVDVVRKVTGTDLPLASDVLLLRGNDKVDCVICHGHQFDTSCTPKYATYLGETLTQAGAWAYQGPDRVWREDADPIDDWRSGQLPFRNELVTDEPTDYVTVSDQLVDSFDPVTGGIIKDEVQFLADALGAAIGNLNTERGWENLYGKNIAWEYFDNADSPQKAISNEVAKGKRWPKFRHLDEFRIVGKMESLFDDNPPLLILGHSHEPRFRAGFNLPGLPRRQIEFYLNTAAAGRFENLIWGIELIDGDPTLISWHRQVRGDPGNIPVRTLWKDDFVDGHYVLRAISSATIPELLTASASSGVDDPTTVRVAVDQLL